MNLPVGVELHGGNIRISFTYRGTRCREVLRGWAATNSNIKKAGILRSVIISEIHSGNFDYKSHFPESKALKKFGTAQQISTFAELCSIYLDAKQLEVSAATYSNITSTVTTLLNVVGGRTLIAKIQHTDLLHYRNELLNGDVTNPKAPWLNRKGRAVSTVNGLMSALCTILKLAKQSNFIKHAPYENLRTLKRARRPPDPLLHGEYQAFIAAVPDKLKLLWVTAIHTGMRHGEICALAWEDINLDKGEIYVSRNITNKGLFVPPKTDAGERTITLLNPALNALREQFQITGHHRRTEITFNHREYGHVEKQSLRFVFCPGQDGNTPHYSKLSLEYGWKQGLKLAGVRSRTPYQSRHTYACWSLSAGANPSFIASQMGHENAKMVYEVYSKWIGEMDRAQVALVNEKLENALPQMRPICPIVPKKVS